MGFTNQPKRLDKSWKWEYTYVYLHLHEYLEYQNNIID